MVETYPSGDEPLVEVVDSWHQSWADVVDLVDRIGHREQVGFDENGYLPARKSMVVAFVKGDPVGYACVTVEPRVERGRLARFHGKPTVAASVAGWGVADGFDREAVGHELDGAARRLASDLTQPGAPQQ